MGKTIDRLRAAAEVQRSLRESHGGDIDAAMAEAFARSPGSSRAEESYREAMARNSALRFRAVDVNLPQQVLDPAETVYEVAVGAQRNDTFPLLIVTDRRVLHVMDTLRGWTVLEEVPAPEVTGAELEKRLLSGRLRVDVLHGRGISMKVAEMRRTEEVAALLRHLAAGGAPAR